MEEEEKERKVWERERRRKEKTAAGQAYEKQSEKDCERRGPETPPREERQRPAKGATEGPGCSDGKRRPQPPRPAEQHGGARVSWTSVRGSGSSNVNRDHERRSCNGHARAAKKEREVFKEKAKKGNASRGHKARHTHTRVEEQVAEKRDTKAREKSRDITFSEGLEKAFRNQDILGSEMKKGERGEETRGDGGESEIARWAPR